MNPVSAAQAAVASRNRGSRSSLSAVKPAWSPVCDLVEKARSRMVERLVGVAAQPVLDPRTTAIEAPASVVVDCPDLVLRLTVVALPASKGQTAADRATFPDEWGESEDWGTLVGTGGYCPQ